MFEEYRVEEIESIAEGETTPERETIKGMREIPEDRTKVVETVERIEMTDESNGSRCARESRGRREYGRKEIRLQKV
jgi:hypothetical protein